MNNKIEIERMKLEFENQKNAILKENNELKLCILKMIYQIEKYEDEENTRNCEINVRIYFTKLTNFYLNLYIKKFSILNFEFTRLICHKF